MTPMTYNKFKKGDILQLKKEYKGKYFAKYDPLLKIKDIILNFGSLDNDYYSVVSHPIEKEQEWIDMSTIHSMFFDLKKERKKKLEKLNDY